MANIILKEDYSIKTVKLNQNEAYDLSDLLFYIPNKFNCSHVFVLLSDSTMIDIVPLHYAENYQAYKIYKMDYSNSIRINSGMVKLKVLLFDEMQMAVSMSNENIEFNAVIDNYKIAHQLAITMELNNAVTDIYNKIMKLTDMNIDIYEKMMEANKT